MGTATELDVDEVVTTVLAVARLGESDRMGWWRVHGLSSTGQFVLEGLFPATRRVVGLELDQLSAAKLHDELLGRASALHLFSDELPFKRITVSWLAERKTDEAAALIDLLEAADSASLGELLVPSSASSVDAEVVGAGVRLGALAPSELANPQTEVSILRAFGAAYATQGSNFRPPYFDLAAG